MAPELRMYRQEQSRRRKGGIGDQHEAPWAFAGVSEDTIQKDKGEEIQNWHYHYNARPP